MPSGSSDGSQGGSQGGRQGARVWFEIGDDVAYVVSGTFVATCLDHEGREIVRVAEYGDIRASQKIGLLTMLLDRTRAQMGKNWRFTEEG